MASSRNRLRSALAAAAISVGAGCSAASDRFVSIDSYPPGANVQLDGQPAEPTPNKHKHVVVPKGGSVLLVLQKDGFQTVAYRIDVESPDRLFFCLQALPDVESLKAQIKELSTKVQEIGETVRRIQSEVGSKGGK